ncbi:hypothetical protein VNI00_015073 [Paramarasmius palmivorus]|uniref:HMG box domain-containing protein n=1 Tax=Paramarasmius palmivorus TaxID=297713 RepID=A0AAW0BLW3_9AGAR
MLTKGAAPLHDFVQAPSTSELAALPAPPAYSRDPAPQTPRPATRTTRTPSVTPSHSTQPTPSPSSQRQQTTPSTPHRRVVVATPPQRRESTPQRGTSSRNTDDDIWENLEDVTVGLRPSQLRVLDSILSDDLDEDDDDVPDVNFLIGPEWDEAFRGLDLGPWTRMYLQTHKFGPERSRLTVQAFNDSENSSAAGFGYSRLLVSSLPFPVSLVMVLVTKLASKKWKIARALQQKRARVKAPRKKRAPLAPDERLRIRKEKRQRLGELNSAIEGLVSYIRSQCIQIASDFKRKVRYVEDRVYQGGVRMVRPRNQVNAFNAFKSLVAKDNRKKGEPKLSASELSQKLKEEYRTFTKEKKAELVEKFSEDRRKEVAVPKIASRGLTQEASSLLANIVGLIKTMNLRVGVEAMLLVTRNRHEPFMEPYWFITNRAYSDYMTLVAKGGFNLERVGQMMQAFAVAKCEIANLPTTANQKVRALRSSIRESLRSQTEDCKRQRGTLEEGREVKVHYENFDKLMTYDQGIVLEGWPFKEVKNLSAISSSVRDLQNLQSLISNGQCRLRLLSDEEWEAFRVDYAKRASDGEVTVPQRNERSDAGVKRGPRKQNTSKVVVDFGGVPPVSQDVSEEVGAESGDEFEESDNEGVVGVSKRKSKNSGSKSKPKTGGRKKGDGKDSGQKERKKSKSKKPSQRIIEEEDGSADKANDLTAPTGLLDSVSPPTPSSPTPSSIPFVRIRSPGAEPPFSDDPPTRPCFEVLSDDDLGEVVPTLDFGNDGPAATVINARDFDPNTSFGAVQGRAESPLFLPSPEIPLLPLESPSPFTCNARPSPPIDPVLFSNTNSFGHPDPDIEDDPEPWFGVSGEGDQDNVDVEGAGCDVLVDEVGRSKKRVRSEVENDDLDVPVAERRAPRRKGPAPRFADTEHSKIPPKKARKPPSKTGRNIMKSK